MAAHIIGDDSVRHAVLPQFPGGQARALVARASFIHPHVYLYPFVVSRVNGRGGGTIIHKGQPARIAVGQNIDRFTAFAPADLFDDGNPVFTQAAAELGIFIGDVPGRLAGSLDFCLDIAAGGLNRFQLPVHRPGQIYGCRAGCFQLLAAGNQGRHKNLR